MSKRTLEQAIVTLIEKHGLGPVESAVRMYKVATGGSHVIKTRKSPAHSTAKMIKESSLEAASQLDRIATNA